MLWVVAWVFALLCFLLVPICFNSESRRELWRKLTCQWRVVDENQAAATSNGTTNNVNEGNDAYHYVLSRAQEDEIRESFLIETLSHFSKEITLSDIIEPDEDTKEDSASEGEQEAPIGDNPAEDENENDGIDVEAPLKSVKKVSYDTADENSSDGGGASCTMDAFLGDPTNLILVPMSGCRRDNSTKKQTLEGDDAPKVEQRSVPNGCAICLGSFDPQDRVTWSNNKDCNHVFHSDCILDWLNASGRKALRRQRRNEEQNELRYANNPVLKITKFAMLCPCCRQDFMLKPAEPETPTVSKDVEAPLPSPVQTALDETASSTTPSLSASPTSVSLTAVDSEESTPDVESPLPDMSSPAATTTTTTSMIASGSDDV